MDACRIIHLPKVSDLRGNLTYIENHSQIPFDIKRVYYLYDVPGGESRGGHAHKHLRQLLISVSGSFDVTIDNGIDGLETYHLSRSYYGLYIPSMIWRTMQNFSTNSVCLVLASEIYDESDYYRDYEEFINVVKG